MRRHLHVRSTNCLLKFQYYYNSLEAEADPMIPLINHVTLGKYTVLDFLPPMGNDTWTEATLQIGRQREPFEVPRIQSYSKKPYS